MEYEVFEERQDIAKREYWSGEAEGYQFTISRTDQLTTISIIHLGDDSQLRLGLVQLRPRSVKSVADFAAVAGPVLESIVAQMVESGMDDLRSDFERKMDALRSNIGKPLEK